MLGLQRVPSVVAGTFGTVNDWSTPSPLIAQSSETVDPSSASVLPSYYPLYDTNVSHSVCVAHICEMTPLFIVALDLLLLLHLNFNQLMIKNIRLIDLFFWQYHYKQMLCRYFLH